MYGLSHEQVGQIRKILSENDSVEGGFVFGSRAMGNYKPSSDVDIAIVGKSIEPQLIFRLRSYLNEEVNIPYFFDLIHFDKINNPDLIEHIQKYGKRLF